MAKLINFLTNKKMKKTKLFLILTVVITAVGCIGLRDKPDIPKNLLICPDAYFEKNEDGSYISLPDNCYSLDNEKVCAYYKIPEQKNEEIYSLEFDSECRLCIFFGQNGKWQASDGSKNEMELIGYIKGACKN